MSLLNNSPVTLRNLFAHSKALGIGMAAGAIEDAIMCSETIEHITDADYPIPYRYCPRTVHGSKQWHSFVMNLPSKRHGHDII